MFENDKKLLGEVLLIIGGFILGETIVRFFLELANEAKIALWILPVVAILLIIDGFQLKNDIKEKSISAWVFDIFIIFELIFIVLVKTGNLLPIPFLWITLGCSVLTTLSWFIEGLYGKFYKKNVQKIPIEKQKDKVKLLANNNDIIKSNENELLRLAIITLLVAGMFGILQYFPEGRTFDSVGMGSTLKTIASTMLYATFPTFAMYLVFLGLNSRFKRKSNFIRWQAFFYDFGIYLTTVIIVLTILLHTFIWLLVKFPNFPMSIIIGAIWVFIIASAIIGWNTLKMHLKSD